MKMFKRITATLVLVFSLCTIAWGESIDITKLPIADKTVQFCYPENDFHYAKVIRLVSKKERDALNRKYNKFIRDKNGVIEVKTISEILDPNLRPFFVVDIDDFMQRLYDKGIYNGENEYEVKKMNLSKRICELLGIKYNENEDRKYIASFVITSTSNSPNLDNLIIKPTEEEKSYKLVTKYPENFEKLKNRYNGNEYFTGLGYTYDIGNSKDRIGVTELIVTANTKVSLNRVVELSEFLSDNFYRVKKE